MAVAYTLLSLQAALQTERSRKSGIEMMQQLSKRISLPLLEKDMEQIRSVLADAAQKPGVVLAWALDHQNQIVAFTGSDKILSPERTSDIRVGDVEVWNARLYGATPYLNLVSPVSFAGTRIGKISATLAPDVSDEFQPLFFRVIVLSGLFFLVLIVALYRRQITACGATVWNHRRPIEPSSPGLNHARFSCPLCGHRHLFSRDLFEASNLDTAPAVISPAVEPEPDPKAGGGIVQWRDVGGREDLAWFKRRAILRCAEIIRVLSN